MGMRSLRRWWDDRMAALALRWEMDAGFRHSFSLLVTAVTLTLVALCLLTAALVVHGIVPQWFGEAAGGANPGATGGQATFPIAPLRPLPTTQRVAPIAVATTTQGPPMQPTPLPTASPVLSATVTATPSVVNPPACPALSGAPLLGGRSVQDGTLPQPLQGGCPAQIVLRAATHPSASVVVTLTFGNLDPIGCTLTLNGTTDGAGNAALPFTVPGSQCFHGTIITGGTITVGGDNSANANFTAQA